MINLTNTELTSVLTAIKRASVGSDTDKLILTRISDQFGQQVKTLMTQVEVGDVYSFELIARQALILLVAKNASPPDIVFDLGCGLSVLGRKLANHFGVGVIEVDTSKVIEVRQICLSGILSGSDPVQLSGNVCSHEIWGEVDKIPFSRPVFVCEGLMRYLSMEEKSIVARNILQRIGRHGTWITCDLTLASLVEKEEQKADIQSEDLADIVYQKKGNSFSSLPECLAFFEAHGFSVEHTKGTDWQHDFSKLVPASCVHLLREGCKYINVLTLRDPKV